ncbi:MAG: hypothetical protein M1826_006358 [Phylliscum demangeonii]|nr:MAG: hypothetical protein M1826_006358 [Phylliscum demangeonii]
MVSDDDDTPKLSAETAKALQDFCSDQDERQQQFAAAQQRVRVDEAASMSIEAFGEDWNASQFWYDDETATTLAEQLLDGTDARSCIAVISAPSVFLKLRARHALLPEDQRPEICLLEFDRRFAVLPEFVPYDFQRPLDLPRELSPLFPIHSARISRRGAPVDVEQAREGGKKARPKTADDDGGGGGGGGGGGRPVRLVLCTGETMRPLLTTLHRLAGLRLTTFRPGHTRPLQNAFVCMANWECAAWDWQLD